MQGKKSVKTNAGAFITMVITIIVLLFACIKFLALYGKKNPVVTSYERAYITNYENAINLNEVGFRFAFGFIGDDDGLPRDDPAYVKNHLQYIVYRDSVREYIQVPIHKCTEEDYAQFNPVVTTDQKKLQGFKDMNALYCIDWDDENPFLALGNDDDPDYARLDYKLGPCNEIDITPDIHPDCHYEPEDQFKYLSSSINLVVYHNNEHFDT